jgi:hypothetical protein
LRRRGWSRWWRRRRRAWLESRRRLWLRKNGVRDGTGEGDREKGAQGPASGTGEVLKKLVNMLDCFFLACSSYLRSTSVISLQMRESSKDKAKETTHLDLLLLLLLLLLLNLLLLSLLRVPLSLRRFTFFALLILFGGIGGFLAGFLLRVGRMRGEERGGPSGMWRRKVGQVEKRRKE